MAKADIGNSIWAARMRSLLRIVVGFLYLQHGTSKFFNIPPTAAYGHYQMFSLIWWAAILEIVGGLLIFLGLFTRPVAFLLSGQMAVAYFKAHAAKHFSPLVNGGEDAVLYCFVFLYFSLVGPGPWSLDAMLRRKR